ncbi:hypothetical protein Mapa_002738 [Marchantia paleacea]|nr:hypothetical protein Mapa_002738 [Marchantia paleacea]
MCMVEVACGDNGAPTRSIVGFNTVKRSTQIGLTHCFANFDDVRTKKRQIIKMQMQSPALPDKTVEITSTSQQRINYNSRWNISTPSGECEESDLLVFNT